MWKQKFDPAKLVKWSLGTWNQREPQEVHQEEEENFTCLGEDL